MKNTETKLIQHVKIHLYGNFERYELYILAEFFPLKKFKNMKKL